MLAARRFKSTKGASGIVGVLWDHGGVAPQTMHSWEILEPVSLKPAGVVSTAFLTVGARDFREAASRVQRLPYGRNASSSDVLAVLREGRGTCSTKHALLRRLALEQGLDIALVLGIYEMTERNTPGVGKVFAAYGLESLPEAHCYLRSGKKRIDVTRATEQASPQRITHFTHEEEIAPDQIGDYKASIHRRFLRLWMERGGIGMLHSLDELWRIREECIRVLEQS